MIYLALIHRFRFWSIVAVETNPRELVDFCISGGTLYSLKVFGRCTEDLDKLFVRWGLCGTFISLDTRHSPNSIQVVTVQGTEEKEGKGVTVYEKQAAFKNLFCHGSSRT